MKVFISYSTKDKPLAERLYADMKASGAEVFQFGKTERAGKEAWEQVLGWINQSDVFIVLLSSSALDSHPVEVEIAQAHYAYTNSRGKKPEYVIPAIIENGVKAPLLIERFANLNLTAYEAGRDQLLSQLGLQKPTLLPTRIRPLPDLSTLYLDYQRTHPEPSVATESARSAEELLRNYKALKPTSLEPAAEAHHIDALLAGEPSKFDSLFLGYEPNAEPTDLPKWLTRVDWSKYHKPLDAPTLKLELFQLAWSAVDGATGYALTRSSSTGSPAEEVYRGPKSEYHIFYVEQFFGTYRVRALGGVFRGESDWSNPVTVAAPTGLLSTTFDPTEPTSNLPVASFGFPKLNLTGSGVRPVAPTLESSGLGILKWTAVQGATYVLERSIWETFEPAEVVYEGSGTTYFPFDSFSPRAGALPIGRYYRVKAKLEYLGESDWSETVRLDR